MVAKVDVKAETNEDASAQALRTSHFNSARAHRIIDDLPESQYRRQCFGTD
jgi:hypothetical protein